MFDPIRPKRNEVDKDWKSMTVAFRIGKDVKQALDRYLEDHPRETQTGLMIDLLEREMIRLGYLAPYGSRQTSLLDRLQSDEESPGIIADQLDRMALGLKRASEQLRHE